MHVYVDMCEYTSTIRSMHIYMHIFIIYTTYIHTEMGDVAPKPQLCMCMYIHMQANAYIYAAPEPLLCMYMYTCQHAYIHIYHIHTYRDARCSS